MKTTLITLTLAVSMLAPGLTVRTHAAEIEKGGSDIAQTAASKAPRDEKATRAVKAPGANQEKVDEDARRAAEEAKNIIVARVNGADINMFMLIRAMNRVAPKYVKEGEAISNETTGKIKKEALDRLIIEELAVQEAIKQGINPAPQATEKVILQIMKNLGSEKAYKKYLEKNNLTEDGLKKLIQRSQRLELVTAKEVYGKVKVDEKLLQAEYEKEKGKYILPDKLVVNDVWFAKGKDGTTKKHAGEVLEIITRDGNDPYKLLLDGTFIVRKITVKKEKYPEIYNSMTDMKVGDLSGLLEEKDGFHIIKVVKKEASHQATFEEAKTTIEPKFLAAAQDQRRQEWENELRKNAKIEILEDKVGRGL